VPEPYWVLATGSRYYADPATILRALREIAAAHPGREFVLLHGQCDPRHPLARDMVVPWRAAEKLSLKDQRGLLGGDWLSDLAAKHLGWRIERRPADWVRHGPKLAGFIRNGGMVEEMVDNGAADGNGECIALTGLCLSARCRRPGPHESHGTKDCMTRAAKAHIPVRPFPAAA
jgi:hypothetical protein